MDLLQKLSLKLQYIAPYLAKQVINLKNAIKLLSSMNEHSLNMSEQHWTSAVRVKIDTESLDIYIYGYS